MSLVCHSSNYFYCFYCNNIDNAKWHIIQTMNRKPGIMSFFVEHSFIDDQHLLLLLLRLYAWICMDEYSLQLLTWQCWVLTVSWNLSLTLLKLVNLKHTSNSLPPSPKLLVARLHANFIQHKWLVDHSTSIATKAEMLVPSIISSN
jgi:hypothetical protein